MMSIVTHIRRLTMESTAPGTKLPNQYQVHFALSTVPQQGEETNITVPIIFDGELFGIDQSRYRPYRIENPGSTTAYSGGNVWGWDDIAIVKEQILGILDAALTNEKQRQALATLIIRVITDHHHDVGRLLVNRL